MCHSLRQCFMCFFPFSFLATLTIFLFVTFHKSICIRMSLALFIDYTTIYDDNESRSLPWGGTGVGLNQVKSSKSSAAHEKRKFKSRKQSEKERMKLTKVEEQQQQQQQRNNEINLPLPKQIEPKIISPMSNV